MANNRLYIVDVETGEHFMLAKSLGHEWGIFDSEMGDQLDIWLKDRDSAAANGGSYSKFKIVTENGSTINNA